MENIVIAPNPNRGNMIINVNSDNRNTKFVINLEKGGVVRLLSSLKLGQIFKVNNIEYIVLEHLWDNATAIIRKELLEETMEFSFLNNDWKNSNLRDSLNTEYFEELIKDFGEESIIPHSVDLLSMDGLDGYGKTRDEVSLLNLDMYRKYRKVLGKNIQYMWWLLTPYSIFGDSELEHCPMCAVDDNGNILKYNCNSYLGVRPFFILKSNIFVFCDESVS